MNLHQAIQSLAPKDKKFFPLFEEAAQNVVDTAILLKQLLTTAEIEKRKPIAAQIKAAEHKGDEFTHQIYNELGKTFITPFDREDIHKLASSIDDVVDFMNGASQRINLYVPKSYIAEFTLFADLLVSAASEILTACKELRHLKNHKAVDEACLKLDTIENQADEVYHIALVNLFNDEKDAIELIKKKEILETLEKATDKAENVSDVLKSIIIKLA